MSEFPTHWVSSTFGDVSEYIQRGKGPKYCEHSDFPVVNQKAIRWHGIEEKHLKFVAEEQWSSWGEERFIREGDILWNSTGTGTVGRACYLDKAQAKKAKVVDSHVTIVRLGRGIDSKFGYYWIRSPEIQAKIDSLSSGSTNQVELSRNIVLETLFPLPPLAEQTRIAAKLDELLAQVDTLKARIDGIPTLLKRFRQSVLAAAVSGRLTEEWRRERVLPEFSEVELGHLIKEGPQNGLYKPSSAYGSGVKIIRIDGFYSGEITGWEGLRSLEVDPRELDAWGIREDDILINRVNSIEYLGKCALVRSVPEPTVFESNIMRMSLKGDLVHPEYLMRFLSSEVGRKKLIAKAKHAVNQASINQGDVKACKVPLPSVEEQTEIVRRVEQLFAFANQLEAKVNEARTRIDRLTQSILAKAFRGELVLQDPNDEPASVLLERIQAQRANAPKARQRRKA